MPRSEIRQFNGTGTALTINRDLVREEEDGEDGENEIDVGIEAQIKVTSAGGAFWADLLVWGLANRKLSEREAKTLEICSNYPKKIPTDFQCKQAVSVLERLKHDGFVEAQA